MNTQVNELFELPLMQNVLADLGLESEAATALALRLARSFGTLGSGVDFAAIVGRAHPR